MSYNFEVKFYGDEIQVSSFPNIITTGGVKNENSKISLESFEQDSLSDIACSSTSEQNSEINKVRSLIRAKQKLYDIARSNHWDFFITLTFSKKKVDRYNFDDVSKITRNWFQNIKRFAPDLKYLIVPEHHQDKAIHFHGLISNIPDQLFREKATKPGFYYIPRFQFGRSELDPIRNSYAVSNYITKYVTKDFLDQQGRQRYFRSNNLNVPERKTMLIEGCDLVQFLQENYPDYVITHSYNGAWNSCYVQLKSVNKC